MPPTIAAEPVPVHATTMPVEIGATESLPALVARPAGTTAGVEFAHRHRALAGPRDARPAGTTAGEKTLRDLHDR
jgi:hypothetical protein